MVLIPGHTLPVTEQSISRTDARREFQMNVSLIEMCISLLIGLYCKVTQSVSHMEKMERTSKKNVEESRYITRTMAE
jgi:hypothetical protein